MFYCYQDVKTVSTSTTKRVDKKAYLVPLTAAHPIRTIHSITKLTKRLSSSLQTVTLNIIVVYVIT